VTSMEHMFYVRSAACFCAACPTPPATQDASRLCLPTTPRLAWQYAQAFNQPLAWDVSSVTSMEHMFYVRSAACLCTACPTPPATQDPSRLPLPTALPRRLASPNSMLELSTSRLLGTSRAWPGWIGCSMCAAPPASAPLARRRPPRKMHLASYFPPPPRLTWQFADAFNQPLAWDVSGVTSMVQMFSVRCATFLCTACLTPPTKQDATRPPLPNAPGLAWQNAQAFNQPLAWGISNMTSMAQMFAVRSAAYLCITCPTLHLGSCSGI
jgi:hypothetical protein